jgi:hypothetical protein
MEPESGPSMRNFAAGDAILAAGTTEWENFFCRQSALADVAENPYIPGPFVPEARRGRAIFRRVKG